MKMSTNLDENGQTVVGIASCVQVVLVFLGDVWHQHVHQRLHCMVEGCRETLDPGELADPGKDEKEEEGLQLGWKHLKKRREGQKNSLL